MLKRAKDKAEKQLGSFSLENEKSKIEIGRLMTAKAPLPRHPLLSHAHYPYP